MPITPEQEALRGLIEKYPHRASEIVRRFITMRDSVAKMRQKPLEPRPSDPDILVGDEMPEDVSLGSPSEIPLEPIRPDVPLEQVVYGENPEDTNISQRADLPLDSPLARIFNLSFLRQRPDVPLANSEYIEEPEDSNIPQPSSLPLDPIRPDVPLANTFQDDIPEDKGIPKSPDLRLETMRPNVPLTDVVGDEIPEDVKMSYTNLPMETLRPSVEMSRADFADEPDEIQVDFTELPLEDVTIDMLKKTQEVAKNPILSDGTGLVSIGALKKYHKPNGKYEVIVDLNTNTSTLMKDNKVIKQFAIATADTGGIMHGGVKKQTPSGETTIKTKVPYPLTTKSKNSYGPYWMGLGDDGDTFDHIGFHGPYYQDKKVFDDDGNFLNSGRLSAGCIRYKVNDLNELAKYVKNGTRVYVIGFDKPTPAQRLVNR